MVMTTVDLNDRLSFEKRTDNKIVVDIEHNYVPNDNKNLAYKAADLMFERFNINEGVTISIDKDIPVSAGLAGGSADAAATMRGLNRLFGLGQSLDALAALGIQIGTDIPFCIYNQTAVCTGRGEQVTFLKRPPSAWVVLAKPNIGISSPDVFKALDLSNRLEPVSMAMHPDIKKIKDNMLQCGADGALMSGSGPTVYGIAQKERQAKNIYNAVNGCCNEVYLVRLLG